MSNLTLEQTVIIVNITNCICIIISLISLFTIFYGNILIDKLKLDTRFPRIGKLINWRRKFQLFYSLIDFFIIFTIAIIMIYINIMFLA